MSQFMNEFYKNLIAYAVQKDIPADHLTELSGIDWAALKAGKPFTPSVKQFDALWQNAVRISGDESFGLHLGEVLQLSALGLIGSVIRNSNTVGEALQHCADFSDQLSGLFATKLNKRKGSFVVELLPDEEKLAAYPILQKHLLELSMAFVLHEMDGLLFAKIKPTSVEMPYDKSALGELKRVLRCTEVKSGKKYRLEFPAIILEEPIIAADFVLQQQLVKKAQEWKTRAAGGQSMTERIRLLLESNCYLGVPSLVEVAANLYMSPRSLQRRLGQEGVSYGELAESVRKTMATHYLKGGVYPLKEISYLLGYNELSAFSRAFKKWTGRTPQDYRKGEKGG